VPAVTSPSWCRSSKGNIIYDGVLLHIYVHLISIGLKCFFETRLSIFVFKKKF
jgi:hypothetical protein